MLRKMRYRFVQGAVAAFAGVLFLLVLGINLLNASAMAGRQDATLNGILEYEQMKAAWPGKEPPPLANMPWADGAEADFTTRFFIVHCNEENQIQSIFQEHIAGIDQELAETYTEKILAKNRFRGYCGNYRYLVQRQDRGSAIFFLDVTREQAFARTLLWVSAVIAFFSLCLVFFLTLFFSRRAIWPYEKNLEQQKRFITDAGHELKTPLTSIAASADILAMEYGKDEWVETIQKQTERLSALVRNLVELSRMDEERPFPDKTKFSASQTAWETAEPFSARARAEGKTFTWQIEDGIDFVGDQDSIQRLMSILLDNAVRYSGDGGWIRLKLYCSRHKLCIEVSNTCCLPREIDLRRLFDRFYRPDVSRSVHTGGSGIGLAMAKAIVENHGGTITAQYQGEESILFRAVLPAGRKGCC